MLMSGWGCCMAIYAGPREHARRGLAAGELNPETAATKKLAMVTVTASVSHAHAIKKHCAVTK